MRLGLRSFRTNKELLFVVGFTVSNMNSKALLRCRVRGWCLFQILQMGLGFRGLGFRAARLFFGVGCSRLISGVGLEYFWLRLSYDSKHENGPRVYKTTHCHHDLGGLWGIMLLLRQGSR